MGQQFYKKMYSVRELYVTLYKGLRTMKFMIRNKKSNELTPEFIERIMLAVTEVNGCEVCSYAHTQIALEQGMSSEEIQMLLSGQTENIPADEAAAVFFAQHYADTKGHPTGDSWKRIVEIYGTTKANGILGSIRTIMMGNVYGLALSAFRSRLRGKPIQTSSLFYEIRMLSSIVVLLPAAAIQAFLADLMKVPIIRFKS